jgi:hypothetical protein
MEKKYTQIARVWFPKLQFLCVKTKKIAPVFHIKIVYVTLITFQFNVSEYWKKTLIQYFNN